MKNKGGLSPSKKDKLVQDEIPEYQYLIFDGNFEGGNLDLVFKCGKTGDYDLFLRPDTNTTGYF